MWTALRTCSSSKGKTRVKDKQQLEFERDGLGLFSKDIVNNEVEILNDVGVMLEDSIGVELPKGIVDLIKVGPLILGISCEMILPGGVMDHELRIVVVEEGLKDLN